MRETWSMYFYCCFDLRYTGLIKGMMEAVTASGVRWGFMRVHLALQALYV